MGNRTNYGTGRMTVDNRQKNERSRSGNPYSSHVKAGKHAGTVYNFKRKSRIRKSLTRLPILLEFIHKYIFLNFVSFYNGLNSNVEIIPYQVITGNYNSPAHSWGTCIIIPYQVITGNYNFLPSVCFFFHIIPYQVITGNYNLTIIFGSLTHWNPKKYHKALK